MVYSPPRPSITDINQVSELVNMLRQQGVMDSQMAKRITEIGAVDLDILAIVLRTI